MEKNSSSDSREPIYIIGVRQSGGKLPFLRFFTPVALFLALLSVCSCGGCHKGDALTTSQRNAVDSCRSIANKAREAAAGGDHARAIALYERCVSYNGRDSEVNDSLVETVSNALVQTMNLYQVDGQPDTCVARLRRLAKVRTPLLGQMCRRDLAVVTAYAMSRTESEREAAVLMDKALRIKPYHPSPNRLFRDYAYAAATYFCLPDRQRQVFHYGKKALAQAHLCKNLSGTQWLTSMLGQLYERTGDMAGAIDMNRRAYDEASEVGDTLAVANVNCLFAELLLRWQLDDRADGYAGSAFSLASTLHDANPMVLGNIAMTKAKTCEALGKPDSALFFLSKAQTYCKSLAYNSGQSDVDLVRGRIYSKSADRAKRGKGLSLLRKVAAEATTGIRISAYYALAKAYLGEGQNALGEQALDSVYALSTASSQPVSADGAYELALDHYISVGDGAKVIQFAAAVNRKERRMNRRTVLRNVAESVVRFDMEKKESELLLQEQKLKRRGVYVVVFILLVVGVSLGSVMYYRSKRRMLLIQQRLMEERLGRVTRELDTVVRDKKRMLEKIKSGESQPDTNAPALDDSLLLGKPSVTDSDGESRFRACFDGLHPKFMSRLRARVPGISRREELLCMLIILGKDSRQIEDILCIAHSSVNMARYRLRQKLQLSRNESLETFLRSVLDQNGNF